MRKKTNYEAVNKLYEFYMSAPRKRGVLTENDVQEIKTLSEIDDRSTMEIRDLRDMVVMYIDLKEKNLEEDSKKHDVMVDTMSAITCVLDSVLIGRNR